MQDNIKEQIMSLFKNKVLNALGVERDLYRLLEDGDVEKAISLMQDHDREVDEAIKEYNPETHKVKFRPNKYRKGRGNDYITEKLPRNRPQYINEVELFFLLGNDIVWKKQRGTDEAFGLFMRFLDSTRFYTMMRKAKRLAGSETESAIVYRVVKDEEDGKLEYKVIPFVVARSQGYTLRPLIDQYGQMSAFAYGYTLNESGKSVKHWDIMTSRHLFFCSKDRIGWKIEAYRNTVGKIPVAYFRQPKAWSGAQERIEREESLDSKMADTNNYFADPIASATADVINSMSDPNKPGKLIQLTTQHSRFEYVNPPTSSETRRDEMASLKESILFDTLTPDFSFEKMKGLGTLSGAAIKNAMILGYIKRKNRVEVYGEMVDRLRSVIIAILKDMNPDKSKELDELEVSFDFGEPFAEDKRDKWTDIAKLYQSGLVSLETAVSMLALTDAPQDEIDRILLKGQEDVQAQMDLALLKTEAENEHDNEKTPINAEE